MAEVDASPLPLCERCHALRDTRVVPAPVGIGHVTLCDLCLSLGVIEPPNDNP